MISPRIEQLFSMKFPLMERVFDAGTGRVISMHRLTNKAATLYEKLRYLVDYKEEAAIRRSAIQRILRRALIIEKKNDVGLVLLRELVGAGYLPNNTVPESEGEIIQAYIEAFVAAFPVVKTTAVLKEQGIETSLFGMLAAEIEGHLFPQHLQNAVVDALFDTVKDRIAWVGSINEHDTSRMLYVACRKSLLKSDNESLLYALWMRDVVKAIPGALDVSKIQILNEAAVGVFVSLRVLVGHRLVPVLVHKVKNDAIAFHIIHKLIADHVNQDGLVLVERGELEQYARAFLSSKYVTENAKVLRASIRAVLYILVTKMLLALALEVPYGYFISKHINYIPLAVNVIFHPLVLLAMTRSISPLGEANTKRIVERLMTIVYGGEVDTIHVRFRKTSGRLGLLFGVMYTVIMAITFGGIIIGLHALQFNIASITLFLFFLALISYFGLRIRHNAQGWKFVIEDDKVLPLFWGAFTLPVVRVGYWLSEKFAAINLFVFIFDIIVEAPFKLILKTTDAFIAFLKEKREELY